MVFLLRVAQDGNTLAIRNPLCMITCKDPSDVQANSFPSCVKNDSDVDYPVYLNCMQAHPPARRSHLAGITVLLSSEFEESTVSELLSALEGSWQTVRLGTYFRVFFKTRHYM